MNPFLLYLTKTTLISGFLFSYYWICLRNAPFHSYNRFYLLGITTISLILPFLHIQAPGWQTGDANPSAIAVLHEITAGKWEESVDPERHPGLLQAFLNGQNLVYALYLSIAGLFLTGLFRSAWHIFRLSAKYSGEKAGGIRIFLTTEPGTPFSFLNRIFWNSRLELGSARGKQVFRHELYHVRQKHTLDLLALEFIRAICWCNPFFHLIRRELKATHEFLADRYATMTSDKFEYAELLVWQTIGNPSPATDHSSSHSIGHSPAHSIGHSFFNTHLKRRITMLTQSTIRRPGYLSRILILPLLFLLFCAFAVKLEKNSLPGHRNASANLPLKSITVVIDPGHGGIDPGTHNADLKEKDLALEIARKIKQLSPAYNINVLMTREEDDLPGGKTTIQEGLRYRTDFANGHKADLFISIHLNATLPDDTTQGVQVWFSPQNTSLQKSLSLGSAMIEEMKKIYPTDDKLKHREEGIFVLRNSNMPAILMECGNMDNVQDLAFVTKPQNQETIARSILQGILRYEESVAVAPAPAPSAGAPTPAPPVPAAP